MPVLLPEVSGLLLGPDCGFTSIQHPLCGMDSRDLSAGEEFQGQLQLPFVLHIDHRHRLLAEDRRAWKSAVRSGVEGTEADRMEQLVQKRAKRKESTSSSTATGFVCSTCSRDCHSRICLHSHTRKCYT